MKTFSTFLIAILLFICSGYIAIAQNHPNSIYFEALGNGGLYSVNYDRLFTDNFGARVGFMYISEIDFFFVSEEDLLLIPATINYLLGNKHKFELGVGLVLASVSSTGVFGFESGESSSNVVGTATIGYRYQKPKGGFLFRAGFTPLFNSNGFQPYAGVSIGVSF